MGRRGRPRPSYRQVEVGWLGWRLSVFRDGVFSVCVPHETGSPGCWDLGLVARQSKHVVPADETQTIATQGSACLVFGEAPSLILPTSGIEFQICTARRSIASGRDAGAEFQQAISARKHEINKRRPVQSQLQHSQLHHHWNLYPYPYLSVPASPAFPFPFPP